MIPAETRKNVARKVSKKLVKDNKTYYREVEIKGKIPDKKAPKRQV